MLDQFGNHIVGFPTRRLNMLVEQCVLMHMLSKMTVVCAYMSIVRLE